MVIEHPSHAYDAKQAWAFLDAKSEFVASVAWKEWRHSNTSFNGPSSHRETVRLLCAESDNLDALRDWCASQIEAGAEAASIHRTWIISGDANPTRLHGLRDNALLERLAA